MMIRVEKKGDDDSSFWKEDRESKRLSVGVKITKP